MGRSLRPESAQRIARQAPSLYKDHLPRHAAVHHKIGAGDESGLFAVEQKGHDLSHILGFPDPPHGMLGVVLALELAVLAGRDPAGADAIDPDVGPETH